jgi:hypothetical protein
MVLGDGVWGAVRAKKSGSPGKTTVAAGLSQQAIQNKFVVAFLTAFTIADLSAVARRGAAWWGIERATNAAGRKHDGCGQ